MKLTFLGATGTVTGSKYLITHHSKKILVDCGLFQGYKALRLRNWNKLPIEPAQIDAVIITHAHIDHTGYLPLLVKNGFKGNIYATPGTFALSSILLPDSGYLQEKDAEHANWRGSSKHHPALPLYTEEDAKRALTHFVCIGFDKPHNLADDLSFSFLRAGHIIGSSFVKIKQDNTSVLFTGDMGRLHDPIMKPPVPIDRVDYLIIESTYGNRTHDTVDPEIKLEEIINQTIKRGGSVIIPAFAVGRAQTLLYYIYRLKQANKIPPIPVFLDSPMAIDATKIFCDFNNEHRISENLCENFCDVATLVNTIEESKQLDIQKLPKIIISASGMAEGGRILHHLQAYASDHRNTILFTGYQAGGTRGARIINQEQAVKIYGEMVPIHAQIEVLTSLSAHADRNELLEWCKHFTVPPHKTFITHGEPQAAESFKILLEEELNWNCMIPTYLQTETLGDG
jgi:metallo-beta-lactamase family protein